MMKASKWPEKERKYEANGELSFHILARVRVHPYIFDGTRSGHQIPRYMNHSPNPNCRPHAPLYIRNKWRVGFYSVQAFKRGEEVLWDYSTRDRDIPWLRSRPSSLKVRKWT